MSGVKAAIKSVVPYRAYAPLQNYFRYITSLRYTGDQYRCPFCEGRFSKFLPVGIDVPVFKEKQVVGAGYRLNTVCPRCYSEDRERLIYLFLKTSKRDVFREKVKLLHVAPERNLSCKLKSCPNIDYVSADLDSPTADVRMDITNIEQDDGTYDVIICNHVLEHIPDDRKAMRELFRVLKRGGFAILQVPISLTAEHTFEDPAITNPADRERYFGQSDHVRIYGWDYRDRLEKAGFRVTTHEPRQFLELRSIREHALLEDEKVFLCSKG